MRTTTTANFENYKDFQNFVWKFAIEKADRICIETNLLALQTLDIKRDAQMYMADFILEERETGYIKAYTISYDIEATRLTTTSMYVHRHLALLQKGGYQNIEKGEFVK